VQPYRIALGAKSGSVRVHAVPGSVLNSLIPGESASSVSDRIEEVEVETLDSFCEQHRVETIDVLKTDTEGYDLEVLKGAESLLNQGRIHFVYSEVTFAPENKQNTQFFPVYEFLTHKGFRFLGLYETYALHFYREKLSFCNALFVNRPWLSSVRGESSQSPVI
jgi:hypothetical protein